MESKAAIILSDIIFWALVLEYAAVVLMIVFIGIPAFIRRHFAIKPFEILKSILVAEGLYLNICDDNESITIKIREGDAFSARIWHGDFPSERIKWCFGSSPGEKRKYYQSIYNNQGIDNGIDEIVRAVEKKMLSENDYPSWRNLSVEVIHKFTKELVSALREASQILEELYPKIASQARKRNCYVHAVEKTQTRLNLFDQCCAKELGGWVQKLLERGDLIDVMEHKECE